MLPSKWYNFSSAIAIRLLCYEPRWVRVLAVCVSLALALVCHCHANWNEIICLLACVCVWFYSIVAIVCVMSECIHKFSICNNPISNSPTVPPKQSNPKAHTQIVGNYGEAESKYIRSFTDDDCPSGGGNQLTIWPFLPYLFTGYL